MNTAAHRVSGVAFVLGLAVSGLALVSATAAAEDSRSAEKSVSCASDNGHRNECPANLGGYVVRDVDQSSRTECIAGRNWGYDDRGVWVEEGCRANFKFERGRHDDHPRSYSYREPGYDRAQPENSAIWSIS